MASPSLLEPTLEHLRWLVACDSTNPPRKPGALVDRLASVLASGGLTVDASDHGDGCVSVLAVRGRADVLLTAHVDTVPVAPGWTREPFALALDAERAYGLGACDVKGGAAAMIAAAFATRAPCALLFTTDEEAGAATCMRAFATEAAASRAYRVAIVAEPTRARAVLAHRGVGTASIRFAGRAAHSSRENAESAVHALVTWASRALARAAELETERTSIRLNIGRIDGGEKPNVVAGAAEARFGVRPVAPLDPRDALERLVALAQGAQHEIRFIGPPLPPSAAMGERAAAEVARLGLERGPAVDFWTEAALLAEAGTPAIVLGPGDIAQAHGADEWVALADLDAAARAYLSILENGAAR